MIDIQNAVWKVISVSEKPKEPEEGQKMQLIAKTKIRILGAPQMLNQFWDSTQAGTNPSDILWSGGRQGEQDTNKFPRWHDILKIEFRCDTQRDFMLKIVSQKQPEESDAEYKKSRIEVVLPCKLEKKGYCEISANAVAIELKTVGEQTDDQHQKLRDLYRLDKVDMSFYQPQADFAGGSATPPPRGRAPLQGTEGDPLYEKALELLKGAKDVKPKDLQDALKIGFQRASNLLATMQEFGIVGPPEALTGARAVMLTSNNVISLKPNVGKKAGPRGKNEPPEQDALLPAIVEHVVTTRRCTQADIQLKFKLSQDRAAKAVLAMFQLDVIGPEDKDGAHEVRWTKNLLNPDSDDGASTSPAGGAAPIE